VRVEVCSCEAQGPQEFGQQIVAEFDQVARCARQFRDEAVGCLDDPQPDRSAVGDQREFACAQALPQCHTRGDGRVTAEVDLDLRSEVADAEAAVRLWEQEGRLAVADLPSHLEHLRLVHAGGVDNHARGVAACVASRKGGEPLDVSDHAPSL
jgi:hypothetical protein